MKPLFPTYTPRNLGLWVLCAALAAFLGPFGTHQHDFALRLFYWGTVTGLAVHIAHLSRLVGQLLAGKRHPVLQDIVTVMTMTIVFSPTLYVFTYSLFPRTYPETSSLWLMAEYVAVVTACISLMRRLIPGTGHQGYFESTKSNVEAEEPPRLMQRLPDGVDGPILRLSSRDHLVEVVTPSATHLVRMRLSDAIAEMDNVVGHSTHRSHWVLERAVSEVERANGRVGLRLSNGDLVPVSRKYRPDLEEAGLL